MAESFLQMRNSIWNKWIPRFVANFKSFENVVDAKGETVAFAMVTGLEEIKENDNMSF